MLTDATIYSHDSRAVTPLACNIKLSLFLDWSRTSPKNGAHFSRPFWIFELNLIVFDFGNLNTINNLNVQIMLELFLGH